MKTQENETPGANGRPAKSLKDAVPYKVNIHVAILPQASDIDINTKNPEFSNWKWMTKEQLLEHIVPFKREVYKNVLSQFSSIIESN